MAASPKLHAGPSSLSLSNVPEDIYQPQIDRAYELLGTKFVITGRDPTKGIDCIALFLECWKAAGIDMTTVDTLGYDRDWWKVTDKQILLNRLMRVCDVVINPNIGGWQLGDWFLFSYNGFQPAHMALVIAADGQMIHTYSDRHGVVRNNVHQNFWKSRFFGYARVKKSLVDGRK